MDSLFEMTGLVPPLSSGGSLSLSSWPRGDCLRDSAPVHPQWPGPSLVFLPTAEAVAPPAPRSGCRLQSRTCSLVAVVMLVFPTLGINYTQKLVDHMILNSTRLSTALRNLEPSEVLGKCPKIAKICVSSIFFFFNVLEDTCCYRGDGNQI